jgi:hypothetical protein
MYNKSRPNQPLQSKNQDLKKPLEMLQSSSEHIKLKDQAEVTNSSTI